MNLCGLMLPAGGGPAGGGVPADWMPRDGEIS